MSKSAMSVFVHGVYIVFLGVLFLFFPNSCLGLLGMKTTGEVWIRVAAWFVLWLGVYYIVAARSGSKASIYLTLYSRPAFFLFLATLAGLKMIEPVFMILGAGDVASAIWTAAALRYEKTTA